MISLHHDDVERLYVAKRILESEYRSHYTIGQLAQKAGLSSSKFKMGFRQLFNVSPYKMLTEIRIKKAKDILVSKEYQIKIVGKIVGFSDLPTFIKCFKRGTGISPTEWRKLSKDKCPN